MNNNYYDKIESVTITENKVIVVYRTFSNYYYPTIPPQKAPDMLNEYTYEVVDSKLKLIDTKRGRAVSVPASEKIEWSW